jgi:SAM-dependent methyltransferase
MSTSSVATAPADAGRVHSHVQDRYGALARQISAAGSEGRPAPTGCCEPTTAASSCCGPAKAIALDLTTLDLASIKLEPDAGVATTLYSPDQLSDLPASVTAIALGCGNPTAIAGLHPGQTVLDLGSGGGIDCFLAARRVGPTGRVIGLDMTTDMIRLARRNARKLGLTNVEFRWGEIEEMPVEDSSVDVVISNCVINLSPDKPQVFREAQRVLRPGGELAVSDMVFETLIPDTLRGDLDSWAGCVAGAWLESDYVEAIRQAGFQDVDIVARDYLPLSQVFSERDIATLQAQADEHLHGVSLDRIMASVKVRAHKS